MKHLFWIFLWLSTNIWVYSQSKKSSLFLIDYIPVLEKKFDVKFAFSPSDLEKVTISQPTQTTNLDEIILFINNNSLLHFKRINKRYITITKKNKFIEVLNTVTLTKYLTKGLQKKTDGSIVLNTKKFGILPGLSSPDIMQSIQILPGIESENESINYLNVRGGTNDQNLILWEGMKMYHSSHFFGLISAYNSNFIDKVTVTKNGTSSAYGNGISSTIFMSNKDELTHNFSGNINVDLINAGMFLKIPINQKLELQVSGRKSLTNFFETITYDNYFYKSFQDSEIKIKKDEIIDTKSKFSFYDYSAKLLYDVNSKNKLRVNYINIVNSLNYHELSTDEKKSNLNQEKKAIGLDWKTQWNSNNLTEILAYHTQYNIESFDKKYNLNQINFQKNLVTENNIKIQHHLKFKTNYNLLLGAEFIETGVLNRTLINKPTIERNIKEVLKTQAVFSEMVYKNKNTFLKSGLRINYLQKFDKLIFEPRFVLKQKITDNLKFKLLGEFKHQTVNQKVDFKDHFLGVENRRWILSDNKFTPIVKSKQISYGLDYSFKNMYVEITSFYKRVTGVTAASQGFYNSFKFEQAHGNYNTYGTEFLINKTGKKYSTWISYTISNNNYFFSKFDPKVFPNNLNVNQSSSLGFNYTLLKNIELSVGLNWKKGNVYTKPIKDNPVIKINGIEAINYDLPNKENLEDFFRIDTSLKYKFKMNNRITGSFNIGILNLTNKQNIIQRYYTLDDNNGVIQIDNRSLKFTPNISTNIRF